MTPYKENIFEKVKQTANSSIDSILSHYLPGGKYKGREYVVKNPTRCDNKPGSFKINVLTGAWSDFAIEAKGGDIISLIAYIKGIPQLDSAKELANFLGVDVNVSKKNRLKKNDTIKKELKLVKSVDIKKYPPNFNHFKHGNPSKIWTYYDTEENTMFLICRFDNDNEKTYSPLTFYQDDKGLGEWKWKGYEKPYPLYNLHLIAKYPNAKIILCEGEKAADSASSLFEIPDYITTTFPHGSNSIKNVDFSPLLNRTVILWGDHDQAGEKCMHEIFKLLGGKYE